MNQLSLEEQWTVFNTYPETIPCPYKLEYNHKNELYKLYDRIDPWEPNLIEERSHEIIRGLLCASDIKFVSENFPIEDESLNNAIIKNLKMKQPEERKAKNIKSFHIDAETILFQQLINLLQIDLNSLDHLGMNIYGINESDDYLPLPVLYGPNLLKSISLSRMENSIEIIHMIQHLLSHSQYLKKISIDCFFFYSLESYPVNTNFQWEEAVKKISNLSFLSIEICEHVFHYDFYQVLLKNQALSLKELKLVLKGEYPVNDSQNMNNKLRQSLKVYTQLEKIELDGIFFGQKNELHRMLLSNNKHLKHLKFKFYVYWLTAFRSTNVLLHWKEKMEGLKQVESLNINVISLGFYPIPMRFFNIIIEGLNDCNNLKSLTLDWKYDERQNTTILMNLIHEMKSLKKIHLPDGLRIN